MKTESRFKYNTLSAALRGREGELSARWPLLGLWRMRHSGRVQRHRAPPSFSSRMHNSISPLWVPELSAYLGVPLLHSSAGVVTTSFESWMADSPSGVAHLHYSAGIDDERYDKVRGEAAP